MWIWQSQVPAGACNCGTLPSLIVPPASASRALRNFLQIALRRCGVTGRARIAPGRSKASSIADAIAAPTGLVPPSPAPLRPSGLSGLGASSVIWIEEGGTSRAFNPALVEGQIAGGL